MLQKIVNKFKKIEDILIIFSDHDFFDKIRNHQQENTLETPGNNS
jgi:hypothetical protein